ncbi:Crp/Fnr family transcriptional regulator [Larkinella bovis]|uniref:Crp/Fnr family transcriptional regulator n=1 Tax=Larkinella bovis TaxID=683041 RepID=A0ABW0IFU5_9BACT
MSNSLVAFLSQFRPIPADDRVLLETVFENRTYQEGDYLFRTGHICQEIFFICNGVLRIVVTNEKGNEETHYFLKEQQFCTILNSFKNRIVAQESIQAACDTEVLAISRMKLGELYDQIPYLQGLIDQIIQQGLIDKINLRNAYLGQDSTTRYRLFLRHQPEIAQRIPLSDVASYLGITPQSLSRIRKNRR